MCMYIINSKQRNRIYYRLLSNLRARTWIDANLLQDYDLPIDKIVMPLSVIRFSRFNITLNRNGNEMNNLEETNWRQAF